MKICPTESQTKGRNMETKKWGENKTKQIEERWCLFVGWSRTGGNLFFFFSHLCKRVCHSVSPSVRLFFTCELKIGFPGWKKQHLEHENMTLEEQFRNKYTIRSPEGTCCLNWAESDLFFFFSKYEPLMCANSHMMRSCTIVLCTWEFREGAGFGWRVVSWIKRFIAMMRFCQDIPEMLWTIVDAGNHKRADGPADAAFISEISPQRRLVYCLPTVRQQSSTRVSKNGWITEWLKGWMAEWLMGWRQTISALVALRSPFRA